jgi:spore coat polysaccharide biosynthesis protein SpsF (cytidylyltransferase family)
MESDCDVYVGDEHNVARRVIEAAKLYNTETIVRITHDCPLIDPDVIDKTVELLYSESFDFSFAGNRVDPLAYPDGLDVDVITTSFLEAIWTNRPWQFHKRYSPENIVQPIVEAPDLMLKIKKKKYRGIGLPQTDYGPLDMRWCLDTDKDYEWIKSIYDYYRDEPFGFEDVLHDFIDWKTMVTRVVIDADNP